jgi:flagellar basal-body rod protein FlgF
MTSQGFPVMGERGPIQLDPRNLESLSIEPTGEIRLAGQVIDKIKLVDFNDARLFTPVSASCFEARDPKLTQQMVTGTSIQQGYLEGANTLAVAEMGNLITSMRMFEANQKVMTMQDERMGRAISDLGTAA